MLPFDDVVTDESLITDGLVFYAPLGSEQLVGSPFRSLDKYGHVCTVTGATWTPQGRTFATDDKIDCGDHASLSFGTGSFAFGGWFKSTADVTGRIIDKGDAVGSPNAYGWGLSPRSSVDPEASWRNKLIGIVGYGGTEVVTVGGANVNNDNTFHFDFMVVDRVAGYQYLHLDTATPVATDISAHVAASTNTTRNLAIGVAYIHTTGTANEYLTGTVGEQWVLNYAPTAAYLQNLRLSTIWRYK